MSLLAILAAAAISFAPPVGSADSTAIAAAEGVILNVWSDVYAVHWQRFDETGMSLEAVQSLSFETPVDWAPTVSVAAIHSTFLIAWEEPRDYVSEVRGIRVSSAGSRLDERPARIAANAFAPSIGANGLSFLVVWMRLRYSYPGVPILNGYDIWDTVVPNDETQSAGECLVWQNESESSSNPIAIGCSGQYFVAWNDDNFFFTSEVRARIVASNGSPLEPTIVAVAGGRVSGFPWLHSIASRDDEVLMLTSSSNRYLRGANEYHFIESGNVGPPIALEEPYRFVVFDGREYVLTAAPAVALEWPFVAIADRGNIHIVSVARRRTAPH